jgi:biopolymer transport protein ExbB/biopolymer transport protein TolQ
VFDESLLRLALRSWATNLVLLAFSVYSVGVMLDRAVTYRRATRGAASLRARVRELLRDGKLHEALAACEAADGTALARVLRAGLAEAAAGGDGPGERGVAQELARGAMQRSTAAEVGRLERHLGALATIGNVSPFVGLFGTVIGIIRAFEAIARTGAGGLGTVSAGIAEALIATAAGLFVAIPAVMAYNHFVGRVKAMAAELDDASAELADGLVRLGAR